jgi:hypothetical protein
VAGRRIIIAGGHLEVNEGAVRLLISSPSGEVSQDIQRRARAVQKRAQYAAPMRTGQLRHSIHVNTRYPPEGAESEVYADAPHASVIEFGRKKVTPTNKTWLHWQGDFTDVFAKSSRAVGGIHYMERSLDAADG